MLGNHIFLPCNVVIHLYSGIGNLGIRVDLTLILIKRAGTVDLVLLRP